MKLVVDENIPAAETAFAGFGDVVVKPGRAITSDDVRDADALIVRSVTSVNRALLDGSAVKFVGSATAGTDHVAVAHLDALGIAFAHAPGSNADSVVDYVLSVLALHYRGEATLGGRRVGVIGCGNVGARLLGRLSALGIDCCGYDPLIGQGSVPGLTTLDEVLASDIVSLHVPLVVGGAYPTRHLLNATTLYRLPHDALVINAARGPVIDNAALAQWLSASADRAAVLDTWEFEPDVPDALLNQVMLATPHIAGYALDGKYRGTQMVAAALARFLDVDVQSATTAAAAPVFDAVIPPEVLSGGVAWQEACLHAYDVRDDDARMREALDATDDAQQRRVAFDALRKGYPVRREFSAWSVESADASKLSQLQAAGFGIR